MKPKSIFTTNWRSKWVGSAWEYKFNNIRNSARAQNLFGAPYPREAKKTYFLTIPNFQHQREIRLRRVRAGDGVVAGPMDLTGDDGLWTIERDYLAAGSNWFRNKMTQTKSGRNMPVYPFPDEWRATAIHQMLTLISFGRVQLLGEDTEEFEQICQVYGVCGFMSDAAIDFHETALTRLYIRREQLIPDDLDREVDRQVPGPTLGTDQAATASVHEFQENEKPLLVISNYGNRILRNAGGHHKYPANLERDQGELVPVAVRGNVMGQDTSSLTPVVPAVRDAGQHMGAYHDSAVVLITKAPKDTNLNYRDRRPSVLVKSRGEGTKKGGKAQGRFYRKYGKGKLSMVTGAKGRIPDQTSGTAGGSGTRGGSSGGGQGMAPRGRPDRIGASSAPGPSGMSTPGGAGGGAGGGGGQPGPGDGRTGEVCGGSGVARRKRKGKTGAKESPGKTVKLMTSDKEGQSGTGIRSTEIRSPGIRSSTSYEEGMEPPALETSGVETAVLDSSVTECGLPEQVRTEGGQMEYGSPICMVTQEVVRGEPEMDEGAEAEVVRGEPEMAQGAEGEEGKESSPLPKGVNFPELLCQDDIIEMHGRMLGNLRFAKPTKEELSSVCINQGEGGDDKQVEAALATASGPSLSGNYPNYYDELRARTAFNSWLENGAILVDVPAVDKPDDDEDEDDDFSSMPALESPGSTGESSDDNDEEKEEDGDKGGVEERASVSDIE